MTPGHYLTGGHYSSLHRSHILKYNRRKHTKTKRVKRVKCCYDHKHWFENQIWKIVIFSDETHVVLRTDHKVYGWRKADEIKKRQECIGLRMAQFVYLCHFGAYLLILVGLTKRN